MGGRIRPLEELEYATVVDALDSDGYLLKRHSTPTQLTLAGAGEAAIGVNYRSSENLFALGTYLTGQSLPIVRTGQVYVQLLATNAAIAAGDPLKTAAGGKCDLLTLQTDTLAHHIEDLNAWIGDAQEAKAINTGGKILVQLKFYRT